jgi:hypothetical protein
MKTYPRYNDINSQPTTSGKRSGLNPLKGILLGFAILNLGLLTACAETPGSTPSSGMTTTDQRLSAGKGDYTKVMNYQQCVAAGFPILRSMPPQCVLPDGRRFVKAGGIKTCVDQCGDGKCAEVVCMALGCPCSESKDSCPTDCK